MVERKSLNSAYNSFLRAEPGARSIDGLTSLASRLDRSKFVTGFALWPLVFATIIGNGISDSLATTSFAHEGFWQSEVTHLPFLVPLVTTFSVGTRFIDRTKQTGAVTGYLLSEFDKLPAGSDASNIKESL